MSVSPSSRFAKAEGMGFESTNNHEGFGFAALPICVPRRLNCKSTGTRIRTETNWLETNRAGRWTLHPHDFSVAQVGFEPTASLGLSQSGLPIAYRAAIELIGAPANRTLICCL